MIRPVAIALAIIAVVGSARPSHARPVDPIAAAHLPDWTQFKTYSEKVATLADTKRALIAKPHSPVRAEKTPTIVLHRDSILSRVVVPAKAIGTRSVEFTKVDAMRGILSLRDGDAVSCVDVVFDSAPTVSDQYRLADVANIAIDTATWSQPSRFTVHVKAHTIDVHKLDGGVETFDEARIKLVLPNHAVRNKTTIQVARD
jgi:hypothetical protein